MKFWDWFFGKVETPEVSYSKEQVEDLILKIKQFNAGAIDEYLTVHVDKVYEAWVEHHKEQ